MASIHTLPPEIRRLIWTFAACRVVEVRWKSLEGYTLLSAAPNVLTLCRDSYAMTRDLFLDETGDPNCSDSFHGVPFSWDVGILYFPYPSPCATSYGMSLGSFLAHYPVLRNLKHLALTLPPRTPSDGTCMEFLGAVQKTVRQGIDYGLALESLTLVYGDGYMTDFRDVRPQNHKKLATFPPPTRRLRDIDDARIAPDQPRWNQHAAADALKFYLAAPLPDLGLSPWNVPASGVGTFGSPEIIWKEVDRGEEDDLALAKHEHPEDGQWSQRQPPGSRRLLPIIPEDIT